MLLSFILFSSCSHTVGTKVAPEKTAPLKIGTSSKDEIIGMFGIPSRLEVDGNDSWLVYEYSEYPYIPFFKNKHESTTFIIDVNGKLKNIIYQETAKDHSPGLVL